jgi:hypothetical protein
MTNKKMSKVIYKELGTASQGASQGASFGFFLLEVFHVLGTTDIIYFIIITLLCTAYFHVYIA